MISSLRAGSSGTDRSSPLHHRWGSAQLYVKKRTQTWTTSRTRVYHRSETGGERKAWTDKAWTGRAGLAQDRRRTSIERGHRCRNLLHRRAHDRFPYSAIVDRPPLRWPNGARLAVWIIPNIEHFLFDRPSTPITHATLRLVPDVLNYSWRDYGVRVGIWRLMDVMQKHGFKGTVALNSDVCRHYPRIIEDGNKLGWEWMGHGISNSDLLDRAV